MLVYCDQTTAGGGLTLVWSYSFSEDKRFKKYTVTCMPKPTWGTPGNTPVSTTPPKRYLQYVSFHPVELAILATFFSSGLVGIGLMEQTFLGGNFLRQTDHFLRYSTFSISTIFSFATERWSEDSRHSHDARLRQTCWPITLQPLYQVERKTPKICLNGKCSWYLLWRSKRWLCLPQISFCHDYLACIVLKHVRTKHVGKYFLFWSNQ